jgi:RNA polymerase sigma factor (sigma-70 family)
VRDATGPSDETLVLACRRGDAAAWEALVARYQRLVYTVPRRAGLSDDLAADVFQHVFATLVEQLDRIEQPGRLAAWLVTTARRETWRVGRRESAAGRLTRGEDVTEEAREIPDTQPLPDELLLRLEEQHLVRQAVEALDERCRTLLLLLFYQPEPPPYAEIATALGTSEGSIGPTRARCLQKLRRMLTEVGY